MTRAEYEAKYGTAPAVATSTPIKMTRAEYEAKYGAPVQAPKYNPVDTLKGKTTFPANTETSNPLGNVARTFGNIPSDAFGIARAAVAPVNPLDTGSSLNIGANLSKGFGAVKDIVKNRGLGGGLKDIAGGFADTATKVFKAPGEFIVGETMKAAQNPAQYGSDVATAVSKIGIEHPLLVPSLIYGSGAKPIAPALDEATKLSTLGDNTVSLAKKLTQKSEKQIASSVLGNYKAGVKPLINAKTTPSLAAKYDEKVVNAVKTIKDNKAGLVFTDEAGAPITGQSPKTLQQFSDAVEQTKKTVFSQYDDLAKKAGDAGVRVEVAPIGTELDTVINNKALALTNPKAIKYAQELQDRLANTGALDATTAQEVIQNYNKSLEAFYRNPSYDNASQAAIDSLVANKMRETLDAGISGMTGTQYSALKAQYGALKAIEKDVIKAAIRDARKNTKGLIDMTDVFSGGQVVNGILSMNPGMIASGATQKGIAAFYKYLNNPNRAINALFKEADKLPVQSFQGKNLPNQSLLQTPAASVIPKTVSTNPMGGTVPQVSGKASNSKGLGNVPGERPLNPVDQKIEDASIAKYNADPEGMLQQYLKEQAGKAGNIVNTDNARNLFKDIGYTGTNSAAVHKASKLISDAAFAHLIAKANPGQDAFFMAGGSGAGKSSATRLLEDQMGKAAVVFDGNLASYDSAVKRIKMAEDAGLNVTIPYVYRDPTQAWEGVISRMLGDGPDAGRVVPLTNFMENTPGSLDVVKKLFKEGYPSMSVNNSFGPGKAELLTEKELMNLSIPVDLEKTLVRMTEEMAATGRITKEQYDSLLEGLPHKSFKDL